MMHLLAVLTSWYGRPDSTCLEPERLKADSHIAYRAHAVPLPCRAVNSHMPCLAPALSFVKFRVVAGNIRTASPTV